MSAHAMVAAMTQMPFWELEEAKAKAFAGSSLALMRHYSVETTETVALWIGFTGTAASIYGPLAFATWAELQIRKGQRGERTGGAPGAAGGAPNVTPIVPPPAGTVPAGGRGPLQ